MIKDSAAGFGVLTIVLHWCVALLSFILFGLGIYMTGLDYYAEWYYRAPVLHISLGLVLAVLASVFVLWRLAGTRPNDLPSHTRAISRLAALVKRLLYLLLLAATASGYLLATADGSTKVLFGLIHFPSLMLLSAAGVDRVGLIHEVCAWALVITGVLHALAALGHHFLGHDLTLMRMLKPVVSHPSPQ